MTSLRPTRPSHATVVAYLALFVALGGSAYAVSKVDTDEIRRGAVTSPKIDNRTIKGKDLARAAVGLRQLRDKAVPVRPRIASRELGSCNPDTTTMIDCGALTITLDQPGRILAITTGGQFSEGAPGSVICEMRADGTRIGGEVAFPGEIASDNTDLSATNGFARALVTEPLGAGSHQVSLACSQLGGDARLAAATIAAIAVPDA